MKNISKSLLAVAIVSSAFVASCKKGEEDPTLSFRSRDKRMVGEWTLTSSENTVTNNQTNGSSAGNFVDNTSTVTSISGGSRTVTTTEVETDPTQTVNPTVTTTTVDKEAYTLKLSLTEDGRAVVTTTSSPQSHTVTTSPANTCTTGGTPGVSCDGTYNYTNTSSTNTEEGYWHWADSKKNKVMVTIDNLGTFYVNQLKNDEMVLTMDMSDDDTNSATYNSTSSWSSVGTWTFTQE